MVIQSNKICHNTNIKRRAAMTDQKYTIKVLDKVFKIIALFNKKNTRLTVQEISERLGYNKTSTYRIIRNLEEVAYLERVSGTQDYKLGFALHHIGTLAESYGPLLSVAHPLLTELAESCDETVHLAVLQDGQPLYIDKIESKSRVLHIQSRVGSKLPGHCSGVGKVLLAFLDAKKVNNIVAKWGLRKCTKNTITDALKLSEELEQIRQNGYAIDNEEIEYGLKCIAAPICDKDGVVIAAASISAPKERVDQELSNFKSKIIETTKAIGIEYEKKIKSPSSFQKYS